jgi:hypothetical protein
MYEPKLRPRIFTWLLTAAVVVMIVQAAVLSSGSRDRTESYRIASTRPYRAVSVMNSLPRFAGGTRLDLLPIRNFLWRHGANNFCRFNEEECR